jgi:hypothetical protein
MEGKLSKGETVDFDLYGRQVGNLRRALETMGLKRQPRDVNDSIESIAAEYWSSEHTPGEDDLDRE